MSRHPLETRAASLNFPAGTLRGAAENGWQFRFERAHSMSMIAIGMVPQKCGLLHPQECRAQHRSRRRSLSDHRDRRRFLLFQAGAGPGNSMCGEVAADWTSILAE